MKAHERRGDREAEGSEPRHNWDETQRRGGDGEGRWQ